MSEWQPIETAPKDGTYVLIVDDEARRYWPDEIEGWMFMASFDGRYWRIAIDGQMVNKPSHWMPLPEPPL